MVLNFRLKALVCSFLKLLPRPSSPSCLSYCFKIFGKRWTVCLDIPLNFEIIILRFNRGVHAADAQLPEKFNFLFLQELANYPLSSKIQCPQYGLTDKPTDQMIQKFKLFYRVDMLLKISQLIFFILKLSWRERTVDHKLYW